MKPQITSLPSIPKQKTQKLAFLPNPPMFIKPRGGSTAKRRGAP